MNVLMVAHYNKDIGWIRSLRPRGYATKVYSTGNAQVGRFVDVNKGMDAIMYIMYILDHYDDMPERTLFVHHHEMDISQDYPLPFLINNLNWEAADFFSIGRRSYYCDVWQHEQFPTNQEILRSAWHLFEAYLPFPERELWIYAGTQFCVHKKLILQYPREFYESLRDWLVQTDMPNYWSGRVFEWSWSYILTKSFIEPRFTYDDILLSGPSPARQMYAQITRAIGNTRLGQRYWPHLIRRIRALSARSTGSTP